jgi:hypothetical protein
MDITGPLHQMWAWLLKLYEPKDVVLNLTFILIAWLLGWFQKLRNEKTKQRQWTAVQLLDAMRDLQQFALKPTAERPDARTTGINRVLRQISMAQRDSDLLNKKQNDAIITFRGALSDYKNSYGSNVRISAVERGVWKDLVDKLFTVIERLDRRFKKWIEGERDSLSNLSNVDDGAVSYQAPMHDFEPDQI